MNPTPCPYFTKADTLALLPEQNVAEAIKDGFFRAYGLKIP
ncbi:MAG TPA: hypothetical protein VGG01_03380 [Xanthobacteraceae bacterium]|jgi:hypothetical protein